MTLPADVARCPDCGKPTGDGIHTCSPQVMQSCPGIGSDEDGWHDECPGCARYTAHLPASVCNPIEPPKMIVFFCPHHIPDRDDRTGDLFGDSGEG
jgi:hypothetical protein